jgi:hypothetical protein
VRTIYRKAHRFDLLGMVGLFGEEPVQAARVLPPHTCLWQAGRA